mmetsp:Transcript_23585/g.50464  ORF Transcript_23585/g.50464 Transcript_23585/m.50464 type:complete len:335 (+) Transcript_23585:581-1585(+)
MPPHDGEGSGSVEQQTLAAGRGYGGPVGFLERRAGDRAAKPAPPGRIRQPADPAARTDGGPKFTNSPLREQSDRGIVGRSHFSVCGIINFPGGDQQSTSYGAQFARLQTPDDRRSGGQCAPRGASHRSQGRSDKSRQQRPVVDRRPFLGRAGRPGRLSIRTGGDIAQGERAARPRRGRGALPDERDAAGRRPERTEGRPSGAGIPPPSSPGAPRRESDKGHPDAIADGHRRPQGFPAEEGTSPSRAGVPCRARPGGGRGRRRARAAPHERSGQECRRFGLGGHVHARPRRQATRCAAGGDWERARLDLDERRRRHCRRTHKKSQRVEEFAEESG